MMSFFLSYPCSSLSVWEGERGVSGHRHCFIVYVHICMRQDKTMAHLVYLACQVESLFADNAFPSIVPCLTLFIWREAQEGWISACLCVYVCVSVCGHFEQTQRTGNL